MSSRRKKMNLFSSQQMQNSTKQWRSFKWLSAGTKSQFCFLLLFACFVCFIFIPSHKIVSDKRHNSSFCKNVSCDELLSCYWWRTVKEERRGKIFFWAEIPNKPQKKPWLPLGIRQSFLPAPIDNIQSLQLGRTLLRYLHAQLISLWKWQGHVSCK